MEPAPAPAPKRRPMSEINVVPYIDVMLVLLIIFMVTAPMLVQSVPVNLPDVDATPTEIEPDDSTIIITVNERGIYYIERDEGNPTAMILSARIRPQAPNCSMCRHLRLVILPRFLE